MAVTEFEFNNRKFCMKIGGHIFNYQAFRVFLVLSAALMSAAIFSGCSLVKSIDKINSVKHTLESGERAFLNKNYKLAESFFLQSINESKNPWDKNRAIYNLACTKLITAQNDSQFIEAISILIQWKPSKNLQMYYENPQLMIQAVIQSNHEILKNSDSESFKEFNIITDMTNDEPDAEETDSTEKEANQMNTHLNRLLREQDGKIKALNSIVKKQNEKIKLLNAIFKKETKLKEEMAAKKREMEKTIKTLKHQISELERIDQKLQNKRTSE